MVLSEEECSFDFYFDKPDERCGVAPGEFRRPGNKGRTTKVGSYQPNKLGLYDMHGNVRQWCEDLYEEGPARVIRGGGWRSIGWSCRAANCYWVTPDDRAGRPRLPTCPSSRPGTRQVRQSERQRSL